MIPAKAIDSGKSMRRLAALGSLPVRAWLTDVGHKAY